MAYTATDQTSVEGAITALAKGERVVNVTFDDGQSVSYALADLGALRDLLGDIKKQLSVTAGNKRYRLAVTSKGY